MNPLDLDKAYVSPYDEFFHQFDRDHAPSASQIKEYLKHKKIFDLRDNAEAAPSDKEVWEDF